MANCQSKVRLHALTQDLQTRFGVDKERRVHAISHRLSETVQVLRVSCTISLTSSYLLVWMLESLNFLREVSSEIW